jgi:hypothetical protein
VELKNPYWGSEDLALAEGALAAAGAASLAVRFHRQGRRDLTRDELYERARQAEIPGRSEMSKQQLSDALHLPASVRRSPGG